MGVNLRGMFPKHLLKTIYDSVTKTHLLKVAVENTDKVLMLKYMTKDNDGATVDAIGDYSATRGVWMIKPKPGEIIHIARIVVSYKDDGSFDSGSYGNGIVLTNGITSYFRQNGVDVYPGFDPNLPILKNPDWAAICFDTRVDTYGSGEEQLSVRFSFNKTGKDIILYGDTGDEYVLYFDDNFTGLISHRILAQGYYEVGPLP